MSRIIINNRSKEPDYNAILAVLDVMREGRVSDDGKCYCYLTVFPSFEIAVSAEVTKTKTDSFIVWDKKNAC